MKDTRRIDEREGYIRITDIRNGECSISYIKKAPSEVGDALESLLTSYGITKEWYAEFKSKFGLPPTCDCEARQEWLNKTAAAHPTIETIGVKFLAAITRKK